MTRLKNWTTILNFAFNAMRVAQRAERADAPGLAIAEC